MSGPSEEIEQLRRELSQENNSRKRQQELNVKLQLEYDTLLKKLAEAELHIDKLRLGANVELNKWYILRYSTETNSTLRQRLEAEFDPTNRATPSDNHSVSHHTSERETVLSSGHTPPVASNGARGEGVNGEGCLEESYSNGQNGADYNTSHVSLQPQYNDTSSEINTSAMGHETSPQQQETHLSDGQIEPQTSHTGVEGSCSQLSLLHLSSTHSSSSHLTPSHTAAATGTDSLSDDLCISQMSAGTIASCGNAESMLLAHLVQLHSLQEELAALKSKINDGGTSVDEVLSDLGHIQEGHRQLSEDIDTTSAQLEALREKYNGREFEHITGSRKAIEKELAKLSEQLQELGQLIHSKAPELSSSTTSSQRPSSSVPPSSSATESVLQGQMGRQGVDSDSHLSNFYDSLNSPALPTKYLSQDVIDPLPPRTIKEEPLMEEIEKLPPPQHPSHPLSIPDNRPSPLEHKRGPPHQTLPLAGATTTHSSHSGTPLEELLERVGVTGRGLESCEGTLSDLSDVLPSEVTQDGHECLEEGKQYTKRDKDRHLRNGYSLRPQEPASPPSLITHTPSPFTTLTDHHPPTINPLHSSTFHSASLRPPFQQSTPTPHYQPNDVFSSPFPHHPDGGFAGSEFPPRAGKRSRLDTIDSSSQRAERSVPYRQLVEESSGEGSPLFRGGGAECPTEYSGEAQSELEEEKKRPSITVAAIDSLKNELASLKEQIMNTHHQQKHHTVHIPHSNPGSPYHSNTGMDSAHSSANTNAYRKHSTEMTDRNTKSPTATSITSAPSHPRRLVDTEHSHSY